MDPIDFDEYERQADDGELHHRQIRALIAAARADREALRIVSEERDVCESFRTALAEARADRDREALDRQTTSDAWNDMRRQRDKALVALAEANEKLAAVDERCRANRQPGCPVETPIALIDRLLMNDGLLRGDLAYMRDQYAQLEKKLAEVTAERDAAVRLVRSTVEVDLVGMRDLLADLKARRIPVVTLHHDTVDSIILRALRAEAALTRAMEAMPSESVRDIIADVHRDDGGDSGYPGEVYAWILRLDAFRAAQKAGE